MLKPDHKVVIGYTTINVIGVTTVFVKYPFILNSLTLPNYKPFIFYFSILRQHVSLFGTSSYMHQTLPILQPTLHET